jgi:hypothetical protein
MDQGEARLLAGLAAQVAELLAEGTPSAQRTADDPLEQLLDFDGPVIAPEDPVLQRLLPDAYRGGCGGLSSLHRARTARDEDRQRPRRHRLAGRRRHG